MQLSLVRNGLVSRVGLYFRAVGTHALGTVPECYRLPRSHGVLVRFSRFRLGCHHLRVDTLRWVQPPLPRCQRVCLHCHSACLDDEAHCLLVCSHPTIVDSRGEDACSHSSSIWHNMATSLGYVGRVVLVCAVIPQQWMMRHIASSCVNTPQLLRLEMWSCQLWYHLCPRCPLSGIVTFGHCLQLAGSLFQCWSNMLPYACVRVGRQCPPVWWY